MDAAIADILNLPWPHSMYGSDDLARGIARMPRFAALASAYCAPNPANMIWVMVFDVDHPGAALRWDDAHMPPPTWSTTNPRSGHGHLGYRLAAPVARSEVARLKPLRLLARVQRGMTIALDADRCYTGLMTQTPGHARWRTQIWRPEPYDLDELRGWLPENLPLPRSVRSDEALGVGRNLALFDALRCWAYRARREHSDRSAWEASCTLRAQELNVFMPPLPGAEVRATARSVAKWVWIRFTDADFRSVQAARGRRCGAARAAAAMHRTSAMLEAL